MDSYAIILPTVIHRFDSVYFGETIKNYQNEGKPLAELKLIPLVFAGWVRYLMAVDDNGNSFELSPDPLLDTVCPHVSDIKLGDNEGVEEKIKPILSNVKIFGVDLYGIGMADQVIGYFKELNAGVGAVRATLKKYTA